MTKLSVNLNKIALLRNSRGRDFPNVIDFAKKFIQLGVQGITVHPRQDERHITINDTIELGNLLRDNKDVEFNIEGYPSNEFLTLVEKVKPDQCTFVPDSPDQLTSDHGWDLFKKGDFVREICTRIKDSGIRTAIFLDPDIELVKLAKKTGTDRIELYTEAYSALFNTPEKELTFSLYQQAAAQSQSLGIGVNAGHDLDLLNLSDFLKIEGILEVSIGHALIVECIENGMEKVISKYLEICRKE